MKEVFINKSLYLIRKYKNSTEKQEKIYKYGLEGLYNLFTKTVVLTLITIILGTFKEFGLILIFYALLRRYAFGIHADSSLMCWISTLTIYVFGSLLVKEIMIIKEIALIIWVFAFISFLLWAPADTPKRPLIRKRQRKKQKLQTLGISFIYLLIIIFFKNKLLINSVIYSLIIETICINPLIYKITHKQFNNYKHYKQGLNIN